MMFIRIYTHPRVSWCALLAFLITFTACDIPVAPDAQEPLMEGTTPVLTRSATPVDLPEGLVMSYRFNEGRGTLLHDTGPYAYHAPSRGISWRNSPQGPLPFFNGTNAHVAVPEPAVQFLGTLDQGTILVRFMFMEPLDNTKVLEPLLFFGEENPRGNRLLTIEVGHADPTNQKLYFTIVDGPLVLCFDTNLNLRPRTWYHFAAVVGPDGNTGYLNGQELVNRHYNAGDPTTQAFFSAVPVSAQKAMLLGYGSASITPRYWHFKGVLDDVEIYDRALTEEEVQTLMRP